MYQALYRKWRPKTFDDVIGQNHITTTLKNEIKSDRISHAYLFTGSRGTGKTTCAKILAKAVNCQKPENGNPCLKCDICKSIDSENMLDIVEIDAASNNGVENIRSMREEVVFTPAICTYRVYIVDEVHMLSTGAFNAFLKILEEPPAHVIFILATTEIHKLPVTITSRCQRFDFHRISTQDILGRILYICKEEKIKIKENTAKIIANAADGAARDALSILDQCASTCANDIDLDSVKKNLGISGKNYAANIIEYMRSSNAKSCLNIIDELYQKSKNLIKFCEEIMEYLRNAMIYKATQEMPENFNFSGTAIENSSLEDILNYLDNFQITYKEMTSGADKRLELETAFVKICSKKTSISKIEIKETPAPQTESKPEPMPVEPSTTPPITEIQHSTIEQITEKITDNITSGSAPLESWPKILTALKNNKKFTSLSMALKNSTAYESGNFILIDSKSSVAFERLRNAECRDTVKNIIKDITGKQYNLGPYVKAEETKENTETSDPFDELLSDAKEHGIDVKSGGN